MKGCINNRQVGDCKLGELRHVLRSIRPLAAGLSFIQLLLSGAWLYVQFLSVLGGDYLVGQPL
jgi:hypothetical protein